MFLKIDPVPVCKEIAYNIVQYLFLFLDIFCLASVTYVMVYQFHSKYFVYYFDFMQFFHIFVYLLIASTFWFKIIILTMALLILISLIIMIILWMKPGSNLNLEK
jgi:hypothetical protein